MTKKSRRRHSKIGALPAEIQQAVYAQFESGHTYEAIAAWVTQMGHPIGKSSVGREFQDFTARLDRIKIAQKQAETIITEVGARPALELEEANAKIFQQMIMEFLGTHDTLEGAKLKDILHLFARLQTSAASRERVKLAFKQRMDAAFKKLEGKADDEAKAPGGKPLDPDTLAKIKKEVYGLL